MKIPYENFNFFDFFLLKISAFFSDFFSMSKKYFFGVENFFSQYSFDAENCPLSIHGVFRAIRDGRDQVLSKIMKKDKKCFCFFLQSRFPVRT